MELDESSYSDNKVKFYSLEEHVELGRRFREEGDIKSGNELVMSCSPMVRERAKRYFSSAGGTRLSFDDLVSAGNLGLIYARDRYEYWRGIKFNTYAKYVVDRFIINEIRKARRKKRTREVQVEDIGSIAEVCSSAPDSEDNFNHILNNNKLDDRQKRILYLRFVEDMTLKEVARDLNEDKPLTGMRIKQIQEESIGKIRMNFKRRLRRTA